MLKDYLRTVDRTLNAFKLPHEKKQEIRLSIEEDIKAQKDNNGAIDIKQLKSPQQLAVELAAEYDRKHRIPFSNTIIRLLLPLALITFFVLGIAHSAWHPGWLVFLLVPILIAFIEIVNDRERHFLASISPFLFPALFIYFGVFHGAWHPAWVLLLLIFVFPMLNSYNSFSNKRIFTALFLPLLIIPIMVVIADSLGVWHPTWVLLLLLLLPLHHVKTEATDAYLTSGTLTLSIIAYILLSWFFALPVLGLLVFSLYFLALIKTRAFKAYGPTFSHRFFYVYLLAIWLVFVILSRFVVEPTLGWVVFFTIPIAYHAFNENRKLKIDQITTPLILATFFILALTLNAWHPAWLMLLIIPIIKIIGAVRK